MFSSFSRILKFAFQDFRRNVWLSVITISVLALALISINSLIVFRLVADSSIQAVREKIDVSVYFNPEVSAGEVNNVKSRLNNLSEVKEVSYVTPEEALSRFRAKHVADPEILASLEEVDGNPLGAALIIKAHDLENYPRILQELEKDEYSELIQKKNFDDHKMVISKINDISDRVEKVAFAIIGVFIFIAVVIVFNTIRIAIYTHRREIEIKRLVGATNWFIKAPFLMEGVFYSILALLAVIVIVYPILGAIDPYLSGFFENSDFSVLNYFNNNFISIFGWQLLAIILLNIVGSSLAIGRYLKV